MRKRLVIPMIISAILLASTYCSGKEKISYSGFLEEYPQFSKGPFGGADWVWKKPGLDLNSYDKILLEHVVFYLDNDTKYKGIHADILTDLANNFHQAFVDALSEKYLMVDQPGPGVLRVRCGITKLQPTKPGRNTISTVLPIGLAVSTAKKAATGAHANVGQAGIEAEFLDSQTNERLAVAIDNYSGRKLQVVKGMTKWGHVKTAFDFWAKRLRTVLDKAHGG